MHTDVKVYREIMVKLRKMMAKCFLYQIMWDSLKTF